MRLQIVIIGTGLSSLSFIDKYLERNNKITIITPDKKFTYNFKENKYPVGIVMANARRKAK